MAKALDSSAVLALLLEEPGAHIVAAAVADDDCLLSAVNAGEVAAKMLRTGADLARVRTKIAQGPWRIIDVDAGLAFRAAEFESLTKRIGLSLGDRICLALSEREGCPALTADRAWSSLDLGIAVELIR